MIKLLKDYLSLFWGFALQLLAIWLEWLDNVELLRLQKLFYLSSIFLIWIGIIQVLFRARAKNRRRKRIIDKMTDTQQAKKIVELARNPAKKGEVIVSTFHLLHEGGKQMKAKFKALSWLQIVSFVATALILILGIGSAFFPELSVIAENIQYVLALAGIAATPGIFAHGKDLGEDIKAAISKVKRVKELNRQVKDEQKKLAVLDLDYAYLKPFVERIQQYGGSLTAEQDIAKHTYMTQRSAIEKKIKTYQDEIASLTEVK